MRENIDAVKVFYYYPPEDEVLGKELNRQLGIFERTGKISTWHNEKRLVGNATHDLIISELRSTDIILLLLSPAYNDSEICQFIEKTIRLKIARKSQSVQVVPVIFRPCLWDQIEFIKQFEVLPKCSESGVLAITNWPNRDEAFFQVSKKVGELAESVLKERLKQKQKNIAIYENAFYSMLSRERPLRPESQDKLARLQRNLGLEDSEIQFSESLMKDKINDDSLNVEKYRLEVRLNIQEDRGEISPVSRILLEQERKALGLTPQIAKAIEDEELRYPQKYERVFFAVYSIEYFLGESAKHRLMLIAKKLGLAETGLFHEIQNRILERLRISREDARLILESNIIPKDLLAKNKQSITESEIGIDYSKLRLALEAEEWKMADRETWNIFMNFAGEDRENTKIPPNKLLNFPSLDLRTIDILWRTYSDNRFGFTTQIQIYRDCGALLNGKFEQKLWKKFGRRVGWANADHWSYYFELNFSLEAPKGHLPGKVFSAVEGPLLLQIAHIANIEFDDNNE
jgi:hypothetical protein